MERRNALNGKEENAFLEKKKGKVNEGKEEKDENEGGGEEKLARNGEREFREEGRGDWRRLRVEGDIAKEEEVLFQRKLGGGVKAGKDRRRKYIAG